MRPWCQPSLWLERVTFSFPFWNDMTYKPPLEVRRRLRTGFLQPKTAGNGCGELS